MSQIITFYSYKGGVGRTMTLANIAVLLSQWGYKTLMIDWDLEAPGLENFFKDYIDIEKVSEQKGLIDILTTDPHNPDLWKDLLITINVPKGKEPLHFLTAGERSSNYFNKVRNFDISAFYEKKDGGNFIESMRNQWKETYDFILVDSRTGITDIGGICTIQLPDVLALIFTATEMGFNGILDVARRAVKAQQSLPFDRFKLISLPIPARFDSMTEFKISQEWLDKFSKQLKEIYNDWMPIEVDSRKFIELTKIPYIPYFSFGEKLPVIEQGTNDPSGLGYAYVNISALIANNFESINYLMEKRDEFVDRAIKSNGQKYKKDDVMKEPVGIFISYSHKDTEWKEKLEYHLEPLKHKGLIEVHSNLNIQPGMDWYQELKKNMADSDIFLLLIGKNYLDSEFLVGQELFAMVVDANNNDKFIFPIIIHPTQWKLIKGISNRIALPLHGKPISEWNNRDDAFKQIVDEIEKAVWYIKRKKTAR